MKLKDKIKWRLDFLKKIIQKGRFKILDLFYFFLPNSALRKKKIREEMEEMGFILDGMIKLRKISSEFYTLNFKEYQIILHPSMRDSTMKSILDFGIPLLDGETDNSSNWDKFQFLEREGPYELEDCNLKDADIVIDAGANIGLFSLFASKRIGEKGKIFAFEPVKRTKEFCERNLKNNNIKNCEVFKYALGDCNKKVDIFVNDSRLEGSSIVKEKGAIRKEEVEQIKLDDFVTQNNIEKVDFIKADIEGAERYLLEGARETIKKFKPKIAICTYHFKDDPEVIEKFLRELVFEYKIVHRYKKLYAYV